MRLVTVTTSGLSGATVELTKFGIIKVSARRAQMPAVRVVTT